MTAPLFAFLTDAKDAFTELITGCLLVAGGFLIGYLLGGVIAWVIGRYAFKQKDNTGLKTIGKPTGGAILALIVAMIVFTGKGKPHGEGGEGKGTPDSGATPGVNSGNASPKNDSKADPKLPPIKLPDPKPADVTIWVTILEGAALPSPGKFYRLEDEDTARTLEELKTAIMERKGKEKGKVALGIRFNKGTPPGDPRLVTDVTNWANGTAGLDVILPASK